MELLAIIFLFLLTVLTAGYYFVRKRYSYWADRGIPYIEPIFPYGCLKGVGKSTTFIQIMTNCFNEMKNKAPFCGIFFFINPVVLLLDLDLVKTILVKDFQYFMDRGIYHNERDDPLSANLLTLEGKKWRNLRTKLSPTFTSGKIKMMFPTINTVAEELKTVLTESIKNKTEFEMKDMLGRFTADVIGTCAFGLECNSLKDPNSQFCEKGRKIFDQTLKRMFMTTFMGTARRLRMKVLAEDVTSFFMQTVKDTLEYREKNKIQMNDFMDLLIQLKNNGKLNDDTSSNLVTLSVEEIAAQSLFFFVAGFESSSSTLTYCLYELSQHQDIQKRAREEIKEILNNNGGIMTYEVMCGMKYIDQIIYESLRKYPPFGALLRKATTDYTIPGTHIKLSKGTTVVIPTYAIHHDAEIYPNPEEWNPDRFSDDEIINRNQYAFLSFGDGPRNCIGSRFGMMQTRTALVTLLLNFKFSPCAKTIIPMEFTVKDFVLTPKGGLWLNVEEIN